MIGKKKKITKKELQEDKLVTSFYGAQEFIEENKQSLLIGAGVVAFIIVAIAWYTNKIDTDNKLAAAQVSQIVSSYEQGQFQKAIDGEPGTQLSGLKEIVEGYGGTDQGEVAKIYLANSYYSLGKYDEALEYYKDYSGSSKLHQATAYAGIAACYEQSEKFDDAADLYLKAANTIKLQSQTSDYLLNAGINYIKAGSKSEAKSALELLKKEYKTTTAAREVDKYLLQL